MTGCPAITKTSVTLPNVTLPSIFKNWVCVFFSMDKWIYWCLTTYAYDFGGTHEVSNFWADERMIGCPAFTKTSVTLTNATLSCIFQNQVCVFFAMDKWIFGCLTTYAYDLGGIQKESNFWADEQMIGCLAIILTSVTLPFVTLPLLPYTCNLTVVGPMMCLIFERMNGWSDVLLSTRHLLPYQT